MQYKDDKTAFHRSSSLSGDLALLRAFCQWMSGRLYIIRADCVQGLILKNMAGREKDAGCLYKSGYKQ